ncbi:DUF934 domain-containing protein [Hyphomonas johnsonii]|jgi:uncharacterized protein (DUF934 family)|uniref:Oxidoreductase probably involved in sulfite reduction n=1 Tax=Hyphomonas johnsonii MHS-2 TaxID=1280950 RepID=A0A059FHA4_9PROT|nr:DUF934 domain-containing protein [Hyphomonas johnsonii]KCZ89987.1 hypothetical protein HJO_13596 [Hyphomonas johnsonii MHS-2]
MPLIKHGAESADPWDYVEGEAELADGGYFTVRLSRFLAEAPTLADRNTRVGVRLVPDDDVEELVPYLQQVQLIEIDFPKYTDGRGYSQAQLLRRRHGYTGELRAVGHVLRDQIYYMNRSGIDAYETVRADLPSVLDALKEFSEVYQPGAGGQVSVFRKRHGS